MLIYKEQLPEDTMDVRLLEKPNTEKTETEKQETKR